MKHILASVMIFLGGAGLPATGQSFSNGFNAYNAGNYIAAYENFKPLAEQGDTSAQNNLGVMSDNGQDVLQDDAEAVKWYRLAAEPSWRWIAPHAIGFDGFRWHTRAFCKTDEVFKDFLLSRIIQTRGVEASDAKDAADADWLEHVTLEIAPHPELSESQKKVIALDYGMRGGKAKIKLRRALLYYALKRLGLDTDPSARKPQDQQIVLLKTSEVLG